MAQSRSTHKGDRAQIMVPLTGVVYADLGRRAADHGTTINQLAADLLAHASGHPDLVREVHQTALLPSPRPAQPHHQQECEAIRRTNFRIPRAVYIDIRLMAGDRARDAGQVAADLLAIATGHCEAVPQLDTNREVLPLAM